MDTIRGRFKHARRLRGFTQRAVARHFDVETGTVYRWESGRAPLVLETLEAAAQLFNVDRVWLVFGQGRSPQALPTDPPPSSLADADEDDEPGEQRQEGVA
jgi:transcriptional regulator with XRE-family HTH domain